MQSNSPKNNLRRRLYLAYGTLVMLFLGLIYAWSVFITPLEETFGWVRSETSLIFTITMSSFCIGIITAGILIKRISYRKTLYISSFFILAGFIGATRISTLPGIYLTYGIMCGLGTGLGYNTTLSMVAKWFPEKPGFCSGALMMGFGFGSLLLGTSATYLMEIIGWQGTFILFGAISAILLFLGGHIVNENPPEFDKNEKGINGLNSDEKVVDMDYRQMIKQSSFWLFFFWAMFFLASGLTIIGNAVPIAQEIGMPIAAATTIAGLISVTNGASRILFGSAFDWLGKDKIIRIDSIITLVAMSALIIALSINSIPLLVIGFILTGMAYGGLPPTTASFANRVYGPKNYPVNFSILNSVIIPATFIGPALTGVLQVSSGSYLNALYILMVLCLLGSISGFLIKKS